MGIPYSVSRIGTFESCKLQYKYNYIDRLPSEVETIEAFMGSRVHEALKEFYGFIKNRVVKSKEWLLSKYEDLWQKNYTNSIKIVKIELAPEDYLEKGRKCLADYYQEYYPFDQTKIVKTEESISFRIKRNNSEYSFRGVLDRLDWNDREKIFEIHDYKTSGTLITQEEADHDIQLPLYQIALVSQWPEAERAKLVWHFLLFNKQIESSRTKDELDTLQADIASRIQAIEECENFPPHKSALCDWCAYQEICPEWKHPLEMEKLEINEYKKDPGVLLVAKYAELEEEKKELREKIVEIEAKQAKVEEAAIEFAEKEKIRVIDGPNHQLIVTIKEEISAPTRKEDEEKWQELRDFLIQENRFIEVSTINNNMLNSRIRSWPKEFYEKIKKFLIKREIKKVDLRNKE
jgi:putative RecB family exonuclease